VKSSPTPEKPLRVLVVEDSPADAELLIAELSRGGYDVVAERVESADTLRAALEREQWHIVLSDYSMPEFSAPEALAVLREYSSELPFIIVSGTIGEEIAVASLKAGACDFLVKGKLARLIPALERELREVNVRKIRERERQALEEQLRHSQKMEGIGRLAGGIAHDFNNLLTVILGYTEMVLEQIGADKPISSDLAEIRKAADRAAALTRQLLVFSRKQKFQVAALDINEVIETMRAMMQRMIGEDIEFRLSLAPGLKPILADRVHLEQVVMNLVVNARDAMPRGGVLSIDTSGTTAATVAATVHEPVEPGMYLRLTVADTGIGMDADTQSHIFEPFFTTKQTGHGTGLGLATVYGVVQQLGGHITVTSDVGHGSSFHLFFPEGHGVPPVAPPSVRVPAPLAEQHEVVLVVEDLPAVRQLAARVLGRHGYTVIEAGGVAEALALAENYKDTIHLVLSDVVMPTMDGPQMRAILRKVRPHIRVLYMSGYTGEAIAMRGGVETNDTVMEKPFTATTLLQSVRSRLNIPSG
jgi:two-component system cell cycle sensor histidine kinase/response regulator CckA